MKQNTYLRDAAPAWAAFALAATVLLPWYAMQDGGWLGNYGAIFGQAESAPGWLQATSHGRPWLWLALLPLLAAFAPLLPQRRQQGLLLAWAGGVGLAGLLAAGFAIGPQGWNWFGWQDGAHALAVGQYGLGWGGALTLLALLMLLGLGMARLGYFQGNQFVAGAIMLCSALLILFIAVPVLRSLSGALLDEAGRLSAGEAW